MTHLYSKNNRQSLVATSAGFTLIEVVIAVALLSLILSSVYGIFTTISATEQRLQSESDLYHQARVIFDRLGRELSGSYLATSNENSAFRASNETSVNAYLSFTSTSAITNGVQQAGLVRLRYELNNEQGKVVNRLLRSSAPLFAPEDQQNTQRLSSQIKKLQWRFYDGNNWQDSWDSTQNNTLPQTVEISMELMNNSHEISVMTAFDLSLQRIEK